MSPAYEVRRHGGRSNCAWRVLYQGPDKGAAEATYSKAYAALRQGALELREGETVLKGFGAPLLRTRW